MKTFSPFLTSILLLSVHLAFSQWTQTGADINGEAAGDESGRSVSLSADGARMAIGAPENDGNGADSGHVRIYQWSGAAWVQLGADINGEAANDWSGYSVSLSADGNRLAIGAYLNDGNGASSGHTRVYEWNGAAWVQLGADINGEAAGDGSGSAVSLSADGSRVAIGAYGNDGNGAGSGQVRLYQWNGAAWVQLGTDINGEGAGDYCGNSVSLSGDGSRVAIGAPWNDGTGADSGHTRIYAWNGVAWVQLGADINGEAANDWFGYPVNLSADGSRVAIGAYQNDGNGVDSGHARIYQWQGGAWVQLGTDINGEAAGDYSGYSVSLSADGSRVAIGALYNDGNGADSGHTRLYQWQGGAWVQVGADINGEAAGDRSGLSVSLSADGSRVAIGAYLNDGAGVDSGHVRVYRFPAPSTALGEGSGASNTGDANVFLGYRAGYSVTTGNTNTFVGSESGYSNTTGSGNLFLGNRAGYSELGSNRLYMDNSDTATPLLWGDFAADALRVNGSLRVTNLPQNDALTRVLTSDTDGNLHWREGATLSGNQTFPSYPDSAGDGGANNNAYFGHQAGYVNTGADNTFIGNRSGFYNTTGYENSSLGSRTLESNTTGARNTANGVYTLFGNTTGNENTAVGYAALGFNSAASGNTAVGFNSLLNNGGSENTATGYRTLIGNSNGSFNTAFGGYALQYNELGNGNTAVGHSSGTTVNNLSGATTIGYGATAHSGAATAVGYSATAQGSNSTAIGNFATANADHKIRLGNAAITVIEGQPAMYTPSDERFKSNISERDVKGLEFIKRLRPVVYNFDTRKFTEFLTQNMPDGLRSRHLEEDFAPSTAIRQSGFIAQEVEKAAKEVGYNFNGIHKPDGEADNYSLAYSQFVVPLTKAVQELSGALDETKALVKSQQEKITALESLLHGTATPSELTSKTTANAEGFVLYQNTPNPFDKTTAIRAWFPKLVKEGKIIVYTLNGVELESYAVSGAGEVSVTLSGGRLPSGMYLYALVADGQVIDTKKMLLTK